MMSVFVVLQYFAIGTVLFLTYCTYVFFNRAYLTKNTES